MQDWTILSFYFVERRRCGKAVFTVEFTEEPMEEDICQDECPNV